MTRAKGARIHLASPTPGPSEPGDVCGKESRMQGEDRGRSPKSRAETRDQDHQPALPAVPVGVQVQDRGPVGQGEQLPQQGPPSRGAVVLGAGARVPVEVEDLDRQPVVAKELGELLDVDGLARERRRIEAGENRAGDLHGCRMASRGVGAP